MNEDEDSGSSDEEEKMMVQQEISAEELLDTLASKHRYQDAGKIIHLGIIDFLTEYSCTKSVERVSKSFLY